MNLPSNFEPLSSTTPCVQSWGHIWDTCSSWDYFWVHLGYSSAAPYSRISVKPNDWTEPPNPATGKIVPCACSGTFNRDYALAAMFQDDGKYWCSTKDCGDIWLTFDCREHQIRTANLHFHPSYRPQVVRLYTAEMRGTPWKSWRELVKLEG